MNNESSTDADSFEGGYKYSQENPDLAFIVGTLFIEYKRLIQKLQKMTSGDRTYNKTVGALTKLSAVLRDFMKMKGIESSEESLAELLSKLPLAIK